MERKEMLSIQTLKITTQQMHNQDHGLNQVRSRECKKINNETLLTLETRAASKGSITVTIPA